jgi:hypothetical protein
MQDPQQRQNQLFAYGGDAGVGQTGRRKVIFICPQDGLDKQDCEINASLRWLDSQGGRYAALGTTVPGDDLYCHEPFCRALLSKGFEFILVCIPTRGTRTGLP